MRGRKGRHRKATLGKTRHQGIRAQVELDILRSDDVTRDADVRKARLGAKRKWRRGTVSQEPLIGRKSFRRPVLAPRLHRMSVGAKGRGKMIADTRRY